MDSSGKVTASAVRKAIRYLKEFHWMALKKVAKEAASPSRRRLIQMLRASASGSDMSGINKAINERDQSGWSV